MATDTIQAPQQTVEPVDVDQGDRPVPGRRHRRVVAGALAGLLLVLTGVGAVVAVQASARRDALDAYEQAAGDLAAALTSVQDAAGAADGLLDLGDQVTDPGTVQDLVQALAAADTLATAPDTTADAPWRGWDTDRLATETTTLAGATRDAQDAAAAIETAAAAVTESNGSWLLNQATTALQGARDSLDASITDGEALMVASEGKVGDNTVRQTLRDLLDQAATARDQAPSTGATVAELDAATTDLNQRTEALAAARQAVTGAQSAWQAEQDRIAAENAAAAASSTSTGSKGSRATGGTTKSNGSTSSSNSSGSSGTGATEEDDRSLADMLGRDDGSTSWCTSSNGDTWLC